MHAYSVKYSHYCIYCLYDHTILDDPLVNFRQVYNSQGKRRVHYFFEKKNANNVGYYIDRIGILSSTRSIQMVSHSENHLILILYLFGVDTLKFLWRAKKKKTCLRLFCCMYLYFNLMYISYVYLNSIEISYLFVGFCPTEVTPSFLSLLIVSHIRCLYLPYDFLIFPVSFAIDLIKKKTKIRT